MTPKSLLTDTRCVSDIEEFGPDSSFHRVYADTSSHMVADDKVRKLLLCTGKVYYDLEKERESRRESNNGKDVCCFLELDFL